MVVVRNVPCSSPLLIRCRSPAVRFPGEIAADAHAGCGAGPLSTTCLVLCTLAKLCRDLTLFVVSCMFHFDMLSRRFISAGRRPSSAPWCAKHLCRGAVPLGKSSIATRCFSATRPVLVKTIEMTETDLAAVKVDQDRLMGTLHHTCGFGTGQRWGRQDRNHLLCPGASDFGHVGS